MVPEDHPRRLKHHLCLPSRSLSRLRRRQLRHLSLRDRHKSQRPCSHRL